MENNNVISTSLGDFQISDHLTSGLIFKSKEMSWDNANDAARRKGSAWFLPTLEQISAIHAESNFFDDINGDNVYWCIDQYEENFDCAYIYDLQGVLTGHWNKSENYMAIAIKPI
jgi:hypothetical protein